MTERSSQLGSITDAVGQALDELAQRDATARMWDRDHTLWQNDPTEVSDRLAWLDLPRSMRTRTTALREFAESCAADGLTDALVIGMGGSSLFPLVLAETFDAVGLELHILDSVDPGALRRITGALPMEATLVVASSKSGTTVETRSLLGHFWERIGRPENFVAITDPGSALAELARERGFRTVFEAEPDVGGRFSALSHFGLVPAALLGVDLDDLLARSEEMAEACSPDGPEGENPAEVLAATVAGAARSGRDKLTIISPPGAGFGAWVEQLVAESTGKSGRGVVPIVGELLGEPEVYGDDRLFVAYERSDELDRLAAAGQPVAYLGGDTGGSVAAEAYRWEAATALLGALLEVNPFDQPDVESAKQAARRLLDEGIREPETVDVAELLSTVETDDYVALLVYADPDDPQIDQLDEVRHHLRDELQVATTLGIGPRYLHSTGQLHKGGADNGVFLQVLIADDDGDTTIPEEPHTFGMLKRAQAAGDLAALLDRGRRAGRVQVDDLLGYAEEST